MRASWRRVTRRTGGDARVGGGGGGGASDGLGARRSYVRRTDGGRTAAAYQADCRHYEIGRPSHPGFPGWSRAARRRRYLY